MKNIPLQPISSVGILERGIWSQNSATIHLLGLCPLLAVTTTLHNGVILGVASALTVTVSSLITSLLRHWIDTAIRLPVCIIIIATIVSFIDLYLSAYFYDVYRSLGLFIPLIVTNCAIAARTEGFAAKNPPLPALLDGIGCGIGITLALALVGGLRELIGSGGIAWDSLSNASPFFLIAILPIGAFFSLALLIVLQRIISNPR